MTAGAVVRPFVAEGRCSRGQRLDGAVTLAAWRPPFLMAGPARASAPLRRPTRRQPRRRPTRRQPRRRSTRRQPRRRPLLVSPGSVRRPTSHSAPSAANLALPT